MDSMFGRGSDMGLGFVATWGGPTLPSLASEISVGGCVGPATRRLKFELQLRIRQARRPVARHATNLAKSTFEFCVGLRHTKPT